MHKVLVVVDMQEDFINGSLGTPEARAIVPSVIKKIQEYKSRGDEIVFTRDTHYGNYHTTNEGKHLPTPHCVAGTDGWEIPTNIDVPECEHINKTTFGWTDWRLRHTGGRLCPRVWDNSEIEIIGLCTDICVVSNALILKALFPEATISVDASCCAGVHPNTHIAALETMKMCQIDVRN